MSARPPRAVEDDAIKLLQIQPHTTSLQLNEQNVDLLVALCERLAHLDERLFLLCPIERTRIRLNVADLV